jgi:hypothetical protein
VPGLTRSSKKKVRRLSSGQLAVVLQSQPSLRGILLDLPTVVANPGPLVAAGVADRCEVIGDDMLRTVPAADAYLIKRVLMDWGDDQAATILRNCAAAMTGAGKVLVVEMLQTPGNEPSASKSFDLLMLLNQPGGRIRTESEFRTLFTSAGLRLTLIIQRVRRLRSRVGRVDLHLCF